MDGKIQQLKDVNSYQDSNLNEKATDCVFALSL